MWDYCIIWKHQSRPIKLHVSLGLETGGHFGFLAPFCIRHTSGISGGFRQLRIYVSAVMADFETFVMRPKEDTARDKLIPRKLVRQSRGDTKEDVICYHSAHCRQILSIKTPLSSPSNSRIIWHVVAVACELKHTRIVYVCVTSDRTIFQYGDVTFTAETWCQSVEGGPSDRFGVIVWSFYLCGCQTF